MAISAIAAVPGVAETLAGPVSARVVDVIDGDTLVARARIWLGQEVETRVRLLGVDAPELRGRCAAERDAAGQARELVREAVGDGTITLHEIVYDKYGGRVIARVVTAAGIDLSRHLLAVGLARAYGGGARRAWCD